MRLFHWWRRDHKALELAKAEDAAATARLNQARANAAWARHTLRVNHLTERFYSDLRGGKP